jgi:hypothetical protein
MTSSEVEGLRTWWNERAMGPFRTTPPDREAIRSAYAALKIAAQDLEEHFFQSHGLKAPPKRKDYDAVDKAIRSKVSEWMFKLREEIRTWAASFEYFQRAEDPADPSYEEQASVRQRIEADGGWTAWRTNHVRESAVAVDAIAQRAFKGLLAYIRKETEGACVGVHVLKSIRLI